MQIAQGLRIAGGDRTQPFAAFKAAAVCAGIRVFFGGALPNGADEATIGCFCAFHTAACAVDHICGDLCVIEIAPKLSGFFL